MSTAISCPLPEVWTVGARVVLADDHPVLRDGLRRSLEQEGLEVVADVSDGRQAVAAVERELPDVALMDIS
ncbi:MAG: response regulator, partial [Acidimicrobiales bacterium]